MLVAQSLSLDLIRCLRPLVARMRVTCPDLAAQVVRAATSVGLNLGEGGRGDVAPGDGDAEGGDGLRALGAGDPRPVTSVAAFASTGLGRVERGAGHGTPQLVGEVGVAPGHRFDDGPDAGDELQGDITGNEHGRLLGVGLTRSRPSAHRPAPGTTTQQDSTAVPVTARARWAASG